MRREFLNRTYRYLAIGCLVTGLTWAFLCLWRGDDLWNGGIILLLASAALAVNASKKWRGYAFTFWVFVCVSGALAYPQAFVAWFDFRLSLLIVPLIQVIMFGMGTTLSLSDFSRVLLAPWPVFVGLLLQFSLMPMLGLLIATVCGFDGELAAGVVLIGSVSGGVASNLMAYIAKANVALSVTMTSVSTLLAPLMTPLLMRIFAGRFVPIDANKMMLSILNMILVPVVAGLLAHGILYSKREWAQKALPLGVITVATAAVALGALSLDAHAWGTLVSLRSGIAFGSGLIALVALAKLVLEVLLGCPNTWMNRTLSIVSMSGICLILAVIIGATHEKLMQAGVLLLVAAVLHNTAGYTLGYWTSRGAGTLLGRLGFRLGLLKSPATLIGEADCRTVAFEVGMQNGGMATGLAIDVLKSHVAALPPNVFGAWMNISGSVLANWWKGRPVIKGESEPC